MPYSTLKRSPLKKPDHIILRRRRMRKVGKKGRKWIAYRGALKREFLAMGITRCELAYAGCLGDDGLGFAHAKKRRKLTDDELRNEVILCCNICHDTLDVVMSADDMALTVRKTINTRIERLLEAA